MFVLAELKDTIRIAPDQFHLKLVEAIRDEINRKLANKVLLNLGLCIALKDIVSLKDSIILPGDGASHTEVLFRYIVFRPTIGSILTGKIRSCSREGVHVTLGFFDDILIPPSALQHPSRFEEAEQAWVWEYPLEDGAKHDLFMDIGEPIKFRVSREIFEESSPIGPPKTDAQQASTSAAASAAAAASTQQSEVKTPYRIIAAINESGLGVLSWWDQQTQGGDEGDENEDEDNVEYENDEDGEGAYEE
ncbi:PREDICTED: DNA-directed RNA polymerase III subunit RPC8 isoform X1 [Rhagoletis zephyria]|uniref:DNA-directed RNA polymerase III subunit RPC8 isoform X1 n=1 Tax=Rhagoletis zephyria TaxID=28612 RepID=UPI00081170B8|nr:PREDICTED: DNA-directed RNA polymerase III subunit RPC8 isoform X1 [Rhagoletis zephyria]XP_017472905.1 PREDICTED: DNA-directed RNA polymerase III subunit RPC8 isoform X1 [Rhagoletis zephyria]XP_036326868.1 DNA-directed RNA polymerase III subunit RPC8 isoform X1 [Rhagoletis pomonella]